jgi:hypothetical protein
MGSLYRSQHELVFVFKQGRDKVQPERREAQFESSVLSLSIQIGGAAGSEPHPSR